MGEGYRETSDEGRVRGAEVMEEAAGRSIMLSDGHEVAKGWTRSCLKKRSVATFRVQ
jgi:hypothetical protein